VEGIRRGGSGISKSGRARRYGDADMAGGLLKQKCEIPYNFKGLFGTKFRI